MQSVFTVGNRVLFSFNFHQHSFLFQTCLLTESYVSTDSLAHLIMCFKVTVT